MEKRTLGRTGIEVSVLSLGGLFVSGIDGTAREEAYRAVRRALELGINYVDTAPRYGDSEEVLGEALKGVSQPYHLSTKVGGRPQPFDPQDKDGLRQSVGESLSLLGCDAVDMVLVHEPDRPGEFDWWTDIVNVEGPVLDVLDELKAEGKIRFTGLGGTTAYELQHLVASGKFDVVLSATNYSALFREAQVVIEEAKRQNTGVILGSPLQQGALARRFDDEIEHGAHWLNPFRRAQFKAFYAFLDEIDMPIHELGLRFAISNPDVSTVLVGARSVAEVESSVEAAEKGALPADVLGRLQEIADMLPFRPYEEPAGVFTLPFGREYKGPGPMAGGHLVQSN
jgi:aryl-alcohol dehydrogenase-like predicted oxidoreductase